MTSYQATTDASDHSEVEIIPLEDNFKEVVEVINEGFGSKRALFCIPGSKTPKQFERLYKKRPEKMELAFLAVDTESKAILGFLQMSKPGVPDFWGFHTPKPNEVYIDQIAVSDHARGRGIGTKLLHHSENFARSEPGIEILTLDVLRGNKALSLYQRFGFEITPPKSAVHNGFMNCFVTLVVGRPYGWCNPEWGIHSMVKKIT